MSLENFFAAPTAASERKQRMVVDYYVGWSRVLRTWDVDNLGYVDLYAGPGVYDDGSPSTPILIVEKAANDPAMRDRLVMILNEGDPDLADRLEANLAKCAAARALRHYPVVTRGRCDEDISKILNVIGGIPSFPTLFFADPWGYKGLSVELIRRLLSAHRGNDCIFFFNYNRINSAVSNLVLEEPIDAVFGKHRAQLLRKALVGLDVDERRTLIIGQLGEALQAEAGALVPPRFEFKTGDRVSHHLMLVSRNQKGCDIMKGIMKSESTRVEKRTLSFAHNLVDQLQSSLFETGADEDRALADDLLRTFSNREIGFDQMRLHHNSPVLQSADYKRAIQMLERDGRVFVKEPARRVSRDGVKTIPNHAILVFSKGE